MVYLILGKSRILLHRSGGSGVYFEWGVGSSVVYLLHLKHMRETLAEGVHDTRPPKEYDLPLMIGEVAKVGGIGGALVAFVVVVVLHHTRVGIDVFCSGIENGSKKHGTCQVYVLRLLRQLLWGEGAHLLHLHKAVAELGVSAHSVGGKTILCPTKSVEVGECALKRLAHAPP